MKKTLYISSILLLSACTEQTETPNISNKNEAITKHQTDLTPSLQLNDGLKWEISEGMKPFIRDAEELVIAYLNDEDTNYTLLGISLKEKNNALIRNCTMQGKAHDELHNWLLPHMKLVEDLNEASKPDEAHEIIQQLNASFNTFNTYFQ